MSWSVDEALKEVVAEIVKGAGPLAVSKSIQADLAAGYRPDFEREYEAGADWRADRPKILPLAYLVGSLAAMLTVAGHARRESKVPTRVDRQQALAAAYIVSRGPCPTSEIVVQGKYCRDFPFTGGPVPLTHDPGPVERSAKSLALGLVKYLRAERE
ncbi:MAG: hypothetical protein GX178_07645 [Acidobacteria bacterium]|nr:hypothetical protein [Acidobacteriota bacterium]